mgnify:CR=1 FL=1
MLTALQSQCGVPDRNWPLEQLVTGHLWPVLVPIACCDDVRWALEHAPWPHRTVAHTGPPAGGLQRFDQLLDLPHFNCAVRRIAASAEEVIDMAAERLYRDRNGRGHRHRMTFSPRKWLQAHNKLGHRFASVNGCTYIHTETQRNTHTNLGHRFASVSCCRHEAKQTGTPICVSKWLRAHNKLGHRFASANGCTYIHTETHRNTRPTWDTDLRQ